MKLTMLGRLVTAGLTLSLTVAVAPVRAQSVEYHVTKEVALGAPDRWDYVIYDAPSHRVFVAHGDRLTVVDGREGTIVGQVQGMTGGTHGIAIAPGAGLGYTDDGAPARPLPSASRH